MSVHVNQTKLKNAGTMELNVNVDIKNVETA